MLVRALMTADVVTVDIDASLDDAVGKLLGEGVGSVVVIDGETPMGIVTETDALEAARERGRPLAEIAVSDLAHPPLVTTDPDRTVQRVARTMAEEGVKKVVVTEGLSVLGIVTLTDVVYHVADLRKEAAAAAEDLAERDWRRD
ncbi:signal transduction protein with CBS domains [Halosimplex carlsbadense 2-9-1]|uniref:Signal transduction protein with CBS domains n=2 Tax=Halosimplex carlsbadense TaxID=171164 RepID=M0CK07_9EURY|nr:signal transduction protein with CBS domains [Halosimplex carlsbadense 2-9-1]